MNPYKEAEIGRADFSSSVEKALSAPIPINEFSQDLLALFSDTSGIDVSGVELPETLTVQDLIGLAAEINDNIGETHFKLSNSENGVELVKVAQMVHKKASNLPDMQKESYTLFSEELVKLGYLLQNKKASDRDISIELSSENIEKIEDLEIWYILGGRGSESYNRLYKRFVSSKIETARHQEERHRLNLEIEGLERTLQDTLNPIGKKTIEKNLAIAEYELVLNLIGATQLELEEWVHKKKQFVAQVAFDYLGGSETKSALDERLRITTPLNLQSSLWERSIATALNNRRTASKATFLLRNMRGFATKVFDEESRPVKGITGIIESLPSMQDQIEKSQVFEKLENARELHTKGDISAEDLDEKERNTLESLGKIMRFEYSFKSQQAMVDANILVEDVPIQCRFQALLHDYAIAEAFPTYLVTTKGHLTLLVQRSNGEYTLFDNSPTTIKHKVNIPPFEIGKRLQKPVELNSFSDMKVPIRGSIIDIELLPEELLHLMLIQMRTNKNYTGDTSIHNMQDRILARRSGETVSRETLISSFPELDLDSDSLNSNIWSSFRFGIHSVIYSGKKERIPPLSDIEVQALNSVAIRTSKYPIFRDYSKLKLTES